MRLDRIALNGATVSLEVAQGRIAAVIPSAGPPAWQAMPLPVDPHLHLDKTFTASRVRAPGPGLFGAIEAALEDRAGWTVPDIRARAERALEECFAAGMAGLRTHVDWTEPDIPLAWKVLGDLATEWRGRIAVQRAPLVPVDLLGDVAAGPAIAAEVARSGDGVLGAFAYRNDDLAAKLGRIFRLAADHGLALDFHVDEGLDPEARGFDEIVRLTGTHAMGGRVLCGHGCALSVRGADDCARSLAQAARAGVALCVLPATNLWLQDDTPGRTPRLRGIAPLKEARAAGVEVMFGADNVADPFYPLGTYDPLETLRLALVAAHLDAADWTDAVTAAPARALGLPCALPGPGAAADFILLPGADATEALRRPGPRRIFRAGHETRTTNEVAP